MAPNANFQPNKASPFPNSPTALATITINPAAGPLIVSLEPAIQDTTAPPIMAVISPIIAGNSLAFEIPKLKGKANKNIKNPDVKSELKFCFNPAKPSAGSDI